MSPFLEFAAISLAVNVTPGPTMVFMANQALARNARSAIVAQGGLAVGVLAWVVATAVGVAQLLRASPRAFEVLNAAGALYLLVLGLRFATERPSTGGPAASQDRLRATFVQGVLTNLLNPYVAVFLVAALPRFASPSSGSLAEEILLLGLWFTLSGSAVNLTVAALVHRSALSLDDARWVGVRRVAGMVLVLAAVRMAMARLP